MPPLFLVLPTQKTPAVRARMRRVFLLQHPLRARGEADSHRLSSRGVVEGRRTSNRQSMEAAGRLKTTCFYVCFQRPLTTRRFYALLCARVLSIWASISQY